MDNRLRSLSGLPPPVGPYSLAAEANGIVYLSGQGANRADGSVPESVVEQTQMTMEKLAAVLAELGMGFGNVIKTSIFLIDMNDFTAVNRVYATFFDSDPPARTTVQVAGLPVEGLKIEIDMVAAR
ncbi:MAG: RidA family protein [Actinomycetota bacterium]